MSSTVDVDGLLQAARLMDNDDEIVLRDRVALLQTVKDLKNEVGYFSENDLGNLRERVRLLQEVKDLQGEIGHFSEAELKDLRERALLCFAIKKAAN
jgi:hypothetical protein